MNNSLSRGENIQPGRGTIDQGFRYGFAVLLVILLTGLYLISFHHYLLFHSLAELFSISIAYGIFIFVWNSRKFLDNNYLLFIGISSLFTAGLDTLHTLSYKGMGAFPGYGADLPTQLWIQARYLQSLSFVIAPFLLGKKISVRLIILVFSCISIVLLSSIFYWHVFPACYTGIQGLTPFKTISEYAISLIFLISIGLLSPKRKHFDPTVLRLIRAALAVMVVSELLFAHYTRVYGIHNAIGHLMKILSYYFLYKAIIETGLTQPYKLLFRNIQKNEAELRKEKEKAQKYLDIAGTMLVAVNADQKVSLINKKGCEIMGYPKDAVLGKNWFDAFVPGRVQDQAKSFFLRTLSGEENPPQKSESPIITREGEERIISWHTTILKDSKGKSIAALSSGEDITERTRTEEALRRSEERFRLVIKDSPVSVFNQDTQLKYTWIYNTDTQYSSGEILGKTDIDLFSREDAEELIRLKRFVLLSGTGCRKEIKISTARGDVFYDIAIEPLLDPSGAIIGISGVNIDITDIKRKEKEFARLASFPDLSPNPIIEVDYFKNICYLNPAAKKIFAIFELSTETENFLSGFDSILDSFRNQGKKTLVRDVRMGNIWFQQYLQHVPEIQRIRVYSINITPQKKITEALKQMNNELELRVSQRTAELIQVNQRLYQGILERKRIEKDIRIRNAILNLLTRASSRKEYITAIVKLIRGLVGCRYVGLRLTDSKRNVPYEAYINFSAEFIDSENWLSLDKDQCACTRIIQGNPIPADLSCITKFGSFRCNDTMKFVENLTEEEKTKFRGVCIKNGFKSVAVIPIRNPGTMLGAIHLADERNEMVPLDKIAFIESLTPLIGEGITKFDMVDKIRQNNEFLEETFTTTHFSIVYLDRHFNFIRVNRAYAEACGRPTEYFIGKNHFDLYPHPENQEIFQKVVDTGQPFTVYSKPFVFPDQPERGTTYWDWSLSPVKDASGNVEALVFCLVNVTQRKQAEDELLKIHRELEEARRLSDIGTLAATVAHELRNPLAAIHMAGYNIQKKAENPLLEKHLLTIQKKVYESDQIINNLLFYSRIKPPRHEIINLHEIIEDCISNSQNRVLPEKGSVTKKLKAIKDITVEADPLQIKEVICNILNNAFDSLQSQKGKVEIKAQPEGSFVMIRISDNGHGIDPEDMKRVFDPFFTTKAKGTGLGLTVCKQIITLHGGTIELTSSPSEGTEVTVMLPLAKPGKPKTDNVDTPGVEISPKKVELTHSQIPGNI